MGRAGGRAGGAEGLAAMAAMAQMILLMVAIPSHHEAPQLWAGRSWRAPGEERGAVGEGINPRQASQLAQTAS